MMASPASIITRGIGAWGSAGLIITRGYGIGETALALPANILRRTIIGVENRLSRIKAEIVAPLLSTTQHTRYRTIALSVENRITTVH